MAEVSGPLTGRGGEAGRDSAVRLPPPTSPISSPAASPNPEIAARLGVSAGTINVSSALRKLSMRTRDELLAAISSHPGM